MFEKQGWHFLFLALLLVAVAILARGNALSGQLSGFGTQMEKWGNPTLRFIEKAR